MTRVYIICSFDENKLKIKKLIFFPKAFHRYFLFSNICLCDLYESRDFGIAVILSSSRTFFIPYIIVSEIGQTYQQNGRKLQAEVFLSATIFFKHFDMVSKLMRYKNTRVAFNFPSSLHKVVSSTKHRVQSILCIKTCKVLIS